MMIRRLVLVAAVLGAGSAPALAAQTSLKAQRTAQGAWTRAAAPAAPLAAGAFGSGSAALLAGGSDDCATAQVFTGTQVGFDCTAATTGSQSQGSQNCLAYGQSGIENDVWFIWVSHYTGIVDVTTCGGAAPADDTRLAVFAGAGCPLGEPLECSDDCCSGYSCSWVTLEVLAGQSYTLQVGMFPGAQPVSGTLSLYPKTLSNHYALDDSVSDTAWGLTSGGGVAWIQRFNAVGGSDQIASISTAFGSPVQATTVANGAPAMVSIWEDPNDDGDPNDALLLAHVSTVVANVNTDLLNEVLLPAPVSVTGKFFVGASMLCPAGESVAPADGSWYGSWSWLVGNATGIVDLHCLACNSSPPFQLGPASDNVFLLRARGVDSGVVYCAGDGSGASCPCGNAGQAGAGCANSSGQGAELYSVGTPSVASDALSLWAVGKPDGNGLVYMGSAQVAAGAGLTFADGLRCVGGTLRRFPVRSGSMIVQDHLTAHAPLLIVPGSTWHFQAWFEDASAVAPCGGGANFSNALTLTFLP